MPTLTLTAHQLPAVCQLLVAELSMSCGCPSPFCAWLVGFLSQHCKQPAMVQATFTQPSATANGPYDYTRSGNPTRAQLEAQMADLEV